MMVAVILLVTILVFTGLTIFFNKGVGKIGSIVGRRAYARHKNAELILETRLVPAEWQREVESKLSLGKKCGDIEDPELRARARRELLEKMDNLIKYFRNAPVFANELSKRILLEDMTEIRREWRLAEWGALFETERQGEGDP